MLDSLGRLANFILNQFDSIWVLYTAGSVLVFPVILWIMDRVFRIFDIVKR